MLATALIAVGCGANDYAPPPPPEVTIQHPTVKDVTRYIEYTDTTRAIEEVEVRARVKGFLQSRHFEPGDFVEKGDLLFVIDPEPFQVALEAAEPAVQASKLRFRPILMTSFSLVLGVIPLVIATGAGSASRRSLGTVVLGGQLSATMIAIVLVPVFFVVFQRLAERGTRSAGASDAPSGDATGNSS